MRAIVGCAVVLATARLVAAQPAAPPTVRLRVDGGCPDAPAVAAALGDRAAVVDGAAAADGDAAAVTVEVSGGGDGAAVTLASGARVEHRLIAGHDCAALAGAVAALTDAWLLDLTAAPPPIAPPPVAPPPSGGPSRPPGAVAPTLRPPVAPRWFVGAGRGYVVTTVAERTAATRVDAAWRSGWRAARLRLTFDWGDAAAQPTPTGVSVERQPWTLAATLGWRSGGRAWLDGSGGAGLVLSRVDAMGAAALRLHPVGVVRAGGGLALGLGVSVRAEVEAALYPVADRYWVGGVSAGYSPLASFSAGLGVDIALGAR